MYLSSEIEIIEEKVCMRFGTVDWKEEILYSRIRMADCFSHEHARSTDREQQQQQRCFPRVSAAFPTRPQRRSCAPLREGGTKRKRRDGWMVGQTDRGHNQIRHSDYAQFPGVGGCDYQTYFLKCLFLFSHRACI